MRPDLSKLGNFPAKVINLCYIPLSGHSAGQLMILIGLKTNYFDQFQTREN